MSVEDGNKINQVFTDKQKQIDSLKLHLDSVKYYHNQYMIFNGQRLQKVYNSYNQELSNYRLAKAEADSFRRAYEANKRIYEFREYDFRKERINQQVFTLIVMFVAVFFAAK